VFKYEQVLDTLTGMVAESSPGTRIPTEKELAERLGVSTMTVRRALQILTEGGRLYGVPGRGTFVTQPRVRKLMSASSSFTDAMRASNRKPSSQLVEATIRPATPEEAEVFEISTTALLAVVRRIRMGDSIPLGYETATLNAALLPGLLGHDLSDSLYEIIRRNYRIEIERTGLIVSSRLPSQAEADFLDVSTKTPCLQTVVTSHAHDKTMLERTISLFRGDQYELAV